jgi:hypothetical protein
MSIDRGPGPVALPLRAAIDHLSGARVEARSWDPPDRKALIAEVDRAITVLTSVRADLLVAERDAGTWKGSGDPSFEAWRGRTSRTGLRAATTEVRRADTLAAIPAMRAAVDAGDLSVEHVDVVARTASGASAPVRRALASPEGQAQLVGLARRVDAGRFAKSAALWAAALDHAELERGHQAQRAARFLNVTDTPAGTRIAGLVDTMTGHAVRLALEAVTGKPAPDDERVPEQRRADALATIARAVLDGAVTAGGSVRPHVSLIMTADTWAALRARAGSPTGDRVTPSPVAPVTLEDGTPVPVSDVASTLCDCEITRVVVDAASEPVDLGRAVRLHTPNQRRAVAARDGGCFWPGCGAPPRWCEVHHLVWWDRDGGRTTVFDGALACSFHHHEVHRRDLRITRYTLPPAECPPGTPRTRYAIWAADGRVVADGRPTSGDGRPLGAHVRTWIPGRGAVDGPAPPRGGAPETDPHDGRMASSREPAGWPLAAQPQLALLGG